MRRGTFDRCAVQREGIGTKVIHRIGNRPFGTTPLGGA
ncbi:hypothetical protein BTB1458_2915 [Mycobacterium tuberculosis]|nr:hypothetical protein BTB1458_2915 [Mycobacterium tuberculosis]